MIISPLLDQVFAHWFLILRYNCRKISQRDIDTAANLSQKLGSHHPRPLDTPTASGVIFKNIQSQSTDQVKGCLKTAEQRKHVDYEVIYND